MNVTASFPPLVGHRSTTITVSELQIAIANGSYLMTLPMSEVDSIVTPAPAPEVDDDALEPRGTMR